MKMMKKCVEKCVFLLIPGTVILINALFFGLVIAQKGYNICDVQGCNCTILTGGWKNINCYLLDEQELNLNSGHIPKETTEIFISGGKSINFASKTFTILQALSLIHLEKVHQVVMNKRAFFNIQSSSLLVQIINCDNLVFQSQTFEEQQGALVIEVSQTKYVKIQESAFSKLSNCTMQNIEELQLESGAFEIKNLGTTGRHGPVTVIIFVNVLIQEIPEGVFKSSLAEIAFKDSGIGTISDGAFKSIEFSSVQIINTSIEIFGTGAFTERSLIVDFKIFKSSITSLQTRAITSGITNLIINHSIIKDIHSKAIVNSAAKVDIVGNQIFNFHKNALIFQNWNRINFDQNIIENLHQDFMMPINGGVEIQLVSFKGNEIQKSMRGSLNFIQKIENDKLKFDDNFFNYSCGCNLSDWLTTLANSSAQTDHLMDTSFCTVDENISKCFSLSVGIINMRNFTEKTCNNHTICEPYNGEIRTINTTGRVFIDQNENSKKNWIIFIMVIIGFFIITLIGTFIALLVRGSRWLKRKGYFRSNYYSNNNNRSHEEEENTIVTIDTDNNEKLEIPEELTIEFLHELSKRLDDPQTHQDASEMIERLYEMFIIDESYENNNREEEAHLYEELSSLNLQIPPPPYEEQPSSQQQITISPSISTTSPRNILKLMEEKFNNEPSSSSSPNNNQINNTTITSSSSTNISTTSSSEVKPILITCDYSEPIDKNIHLYSELKQKDEAKKEIMTLMRPLPDKPGPSSK